MGPEMVAVAAIGKLALDAGSSIVEGHGESATQNFLAARDKRAAELGRLRADQTDAQLREELNVTLANIDAVRAAANINPTSPTTAALKREELRIGDRERTIRVASIRSQADEDEQSANYRRVLGRRALMAGYTKAASTVLGGFGKAAAR